MKLLNTNIGIHISCIFYVLYRPLEHITYIIYVSFNFLFNFLFFFVFKVFYNKHIFFVLEINTKSPINDNVHYDWLIGVTLRADPLQYIFSTVSRKISEYRLCGHLFSLGPLSIKALEPCGIHMWFPETYRKEAPITVEPKYFPGWISYSLWCLHA